jgi:hypothetical protein
MSHASILITTHAARQGMASFAMAARMMTSITTEAT